MTIIIKIIAISKRIFTKKTKKQKKNQKDTKKQSPSVRKRSSFPRTTTDTTPINIRTKKSPPNARRTLRRRLPTLPHVTAVPSA